MENIKPLDTKALADLQAKHPGGNLLEFADGHWAYFKKPTRHHVGLAMMQARTNPLGLVDVLVTNCVVAQSEGLDLKKTEDVGYLMGVAEHADAIIGTKKAELKN